MADAKTDKGGLKTKDILFIGAVLVGVVIVVLSWFEGFAGL